MGRLARPIRSPDWSRLDRRNPFNKDWPGWAGSVLTLMPFPHLSGGSTWVDPWHKIDGTLTNMDPATDWVGTEHGPSLEFDGSNDYVECGLPERIRNATNAITVAAIVKPYATTRGDIFTRWQSGSTQHFNLLQGVTASRFAFYVSDGSGGIGATDSANFTVGQWYFIVGTYDGSVIRLYRDGVQVASTSAVLTMSNNATSFVRFGISDSQTTWPGMINMGAIWSQVALSGGEVASLYRESRTGFPDALRWLRGRSMVSVPASGSATPWLYARQPSRIIGGGVGL